MSDGLILRVDGQTFADDTFKIVDPSGLVIDAQLPGWCELRWHQDLVHKCGVDLKWRVVRRCWCDLGHELRRAVVRDLRDALIVIVDPSLYRFDLERIVASAVGQPRGVWPQAFVDWIEDEAARYEMQSILLDSPAARIDDYLGDDGMEILQDADGIVRNVERTPSILPTLETTLGSPHNVRLFGARSAAAFAHILDRQLWIDYIAAVTKDMRYVSSKQILGGVLAVGERTQRVFDEGNRTSVEAIVDLKDAVRVQLANSGQLILPAGGVPPGAIEMSSKDTSMLQAADIAAGYARGIYYDFGLRAVCEEFKSVILNGSMVRDWSQVERPNAAELRCRR